MVVAVVLEGVKSLLESFTMLLFITPCYLLQFCCTWQYQDAVSIFHCLGVCIRIICSVMSNCCSSCCRTNRQLLVRVNLRRHKEMGVFRFWCIIFRRPVVNLKVNEVSQRNIFWSHIIICFRGFFRIYGIFSACFACIFKFFCLVFFVFYI